MGQGNLQNIQWNVLHDSFDNGATLRAALAALKDPSVDSRGVYVHVDCATDRVIRVGIATGAGGILARWNTSHWRTYRYWAENDLLSWSHAYPGFFRGLISRQTRLYWTHEADRQRARELERDLIQAHSPAWEAYRAGFSAAGDAAAEAVMARDAVTLDGMNLGPAFVAACVQGAGLWPWR